MNTYTFHPKPIYAFAKIIPVLTLAILISLSSFYIHPLLNLLAIGVCLYGWYKYFYICSIKYVLTNNALQMTTGLFSRRMDSLELFRIKDYVITQSVLMRFAGLMNMTLISTDLTNNTLTMSGISFAPELVEQFREAVRVARQNNKILELS